MLLNLKRASTLAGMPGASRSPTASAVEETPAALLLEIV